RELFFELVNLLDQNPLVIDGTTVNGPMFRVLTLSALYFDASLPGLAELWQQIKEAPSGIARLPSGLAVPDDNPAMSGLAVLCDDVAWPRDVERYRREWEADREAYPLFGTIGSNIWSCAFWPTRPIEPPVKITANGPQNILLLQNLRDPVTPLAGG